MSSRATGGTLAAFLIIAAIVGFAGGAYLGTQSGGDAQANSPGDTDTNSPDSQTDGEQGNADPTEGGEETAGDGQITFTVQESSVTTSQEINYSGTVNPPEEGVELQIQRSLDGGEWTPFPEDNPIVRETNANGEFSGYVQTGRSGENRFRAVRVDDEAVVSEPATVTVE